MDVLIVDENPACLGIVETVYKLGDSGFSATGGSNDGDLLPGGDSEGNVPEDWSVRVIPESDVFKSDGAALELERKSTRLVLFYGVR